MHAAYQRRLAHIFAGEFFHLEIRKCHADDLEAVLAIINDAARAYKGIIPGDRWHEPYMSRAQLIQEIRDGVCFWGVASGKELLGVMGIQPRGEVYLIRHAYVKTAQRRKGIGTDLLRHLEKMTTQPILIGTWADADWAVQFYVKNGYRVLTKKETRPLLRIYWSIPDRQVETSVVLANEKWSPKKALPVTA